MQFINVMRTSSAKNELLNVRISFFMLMMRKYLMKRTYEEKTQVVLHF